MIPCPNDIINYSPSLRHLIGNENKKMYVHPLKKEDVDFEIVSFGDQYWTLVRT